MYKKLARIGPISAGIFYAILTLLMLIVAALFSIFVLPIIPRQDGVPQIDMFAEIGTQIMSGEGLSALAISIGATMLAAFVVGFIGAVLYNLVAMVTGGIKVKVHDLGYDDI